MGKIAVTDFASAHTALCFSLAGGEGREVVVEQEAFATLVYNIVNYFFIELGAESHSREALGFSAGEHSRAVRSGNVVYLAPDRTYFGGFSAVKAGAFVKDAAAHSLFFNIVVIAFDEGSLFVAFLFGERFDILLADSVELILTPVLVGAACLGYLVSLVVAFVVDVLAELLVVDFVAVFAFFNAEFFCELNLCHALLFDSLVGCFKGGEEFGFAHFVHLAFHHHDVVVGSAYHQFHVGFLKLFECGVDDEFAVDTRNTHFGYGTVEGDVAHSYGS